jgi:hypothetical protein
MRRAFAVALSPVLAIAMATTSLAYMTSGGTGVGGANTGTLQTPSPVTASSQTGGAHIVWTIVSSPSGTSAEVTYQVDRSGDSGSTWFAANATCTGSLPRTTTACDDVPATSGTYRYRVTARFRSWTSTGTSNSVTVVVVTTDTTPPTSSITFPSNSGSYNTAGYNAGCSTTSTGDICGTASDPGVLPSGLGKVQVSVQRSSDSLYWNGVAWVALLTWNDAVGTSTWSYGLAASRLTNGVSYTVRSRAIDNASNIQTAPASMSFTFDTTAPVVTVTKVNGSVVTFPYTTNVNVTTLGGACGTAPGDLAAVSWSVTGTATRSGTATCTAGSWTATPSPALSTSGTYSVTATQTDAAGNVGSSNVASIVIDKTAPFAQGIQTGNGSNPGQLDVGDFVGYQFSEPMSPGSILTGWNGSSVSVTVSFNDAGSSDTITVPGTNLGTVALGGNYMKSTQTVTADMRMTGSTVTVTLTSLPPAGQVNSVPSSTVVWSPSTLAKDVVGNSMSSASVTQAGAPNQLF